MQRSALFVAALAVCSIVVVGVAVADSHTLTGEYRSDFGNGDLTADFTSIGRDTWNVAFRFRFDGQRHVYRGTARGSLSAGRLEGDVKAENGRAFSFDGAFQQGWFRGTHYEVKRGRAHRTGTLTLRR